MAFAVRFIHRATPTVLLVHAVSDPERASVRAEQSAHLARQLDAKRAEVRAEIIPPKTLALWAGPIHFDEERIEPAVIRLTATRTVFVIRAAGTCNEAETHAAALDKQIAVREQGEPGVLQFLRVDGAWRNC